jgi:xanthine/CO dehydrogenase XdhC/CoxF family maturation factor
MDLLKKSCAYGKAGQRAALATIVHQRLDSQLRKFAHAGSRRQLIAGTIGGGCVEADVWAAAKRS